MHRMMTKEAIALRREHAKEILRKNPELTNQEVRERARCCIDTVTQVRKELRREAKIE